MRKKKWGGVFRLVWVTAAAIAAALLLWPRQAEAPVQEKAEELPTPPAASVTGEGQRMEKDCQIIQTMAFSRCGHSVTRRVSAPEALAGEGFEAARAYYDAWSIESFSPENVTMQREIDLFCPMHAVLSVNDAGEAVLTKNVYGDGMAVEKTYALTLADFEPEDRQALLRGIGFDSREEAEKWMEERRKKQERGSRTQEVILCALFAAVK